MKRPLACIGFSMLFSLVFAIAFHTVALYCAVVCFIFSVVCFIIRFVKRKNTISVAVCLLSACIAMLGYCGTVEDYVKPIVSEFDGETVEFSGTIISEPYTNGSNTRFTVKTDTINGESKHLNIQITTSYTLPAEIYDCINGNAELYSIYESGYGYASYYGARRIFLGAYINPYYDSGYEIVHSESRPFYAVFSDVRNYIANTFRKYLSYDEYALCTAVITGDRNYLNDEVYSAFKMLGVSHILVVSGLHLSVVSGILYSVCRKTVRNEYISAVIQILGITLFALMTGFGFSITRAYIMSLLTILSGIFIQKTDGLNSLGFSAIILCANPLNAGDIGMLWSFACTMSIMVLAKPIRKFIRKTLMLKGSRLVRITELFSTTVTAMVGSIPFMILVTGSISPYTIIVNLLTVPFTGVLIFCGGMSVIMFALHITVFAYPLMLVGGLTAKYLIFVTNTFYGLPFSTVSVEKIYVYIWAIIFIAVLILLWIFDKRKKFFKLSITAMLVIAVGLYCFDWFLTSEQTTLSVLAVEEGLTVTLKISDDVVILNSYGKKSEYSTVKAEFSEFGKEIICLIDIPPEKAYSYGRRLANEFDIDQILLYDTDKYSWFKYNGADVEQISENFLLHIRDGITLNILTTDSGTWEYLNVYSNEVLICPPNSDFDELPEEFRNPDIVVVSDIPQNLALPNYTRVIVSDCVGDTINYFTDRGFTAKDISEQGRFNISIAKDGI